MKLALKLAPLVLIGSMEACASGLSSSAQVKTTTAPNADFAGYRRFAFRTAAQPLAPFQASSRSFEVERRLQPLLEAELASKGYVETSADDKPDFVVAFASGYAGITEVPEGQLDWRPPVLKGQIVIDAFDSTSNGQVWRGVAETEVDPRTINDQLLRDTVRHVLASFPSHGP